MATQDIVPASNEKPAQPAAAPVAPQASAPAEVKKSKVPKFKFNKKVLLVVVLVLVILGVMGALLMSKSKEAAQLREDKARLANPQEVAKAEAEKLTKVLGASIELPQGETPTIATVVDASKLKGQAFFANAQNGDKVFIYTQAKKAILFRPSTNKIVEVAPINLGDQQQAQPQTNTKKP